VTFEVVQYRAADHEALWDAWCGTVPNATFLHSRRFLGYHGARFADCSVLLYQAGRLVAVMPAAAMPDDPDAVGSHPGATYGGLVHDGSVTGERAIEAIAQLRAHYRAAGFGRLVYKAMPRQFKPVPGDDDLYALFRLDARRVACNLACVIDLAHRRTPSERRRRALRKARRSVEVVTDIALLPALWEIIADNVARRFGARPVHSREELVRLAELFPENVRLYGGTVDGRLEAGIVLFNTATTWRAQYIGSTEAGHEASALDAVLEDAIAAAAARGARYVDFGTSNADDGRVLNEGLYRFKVEFGGGGAVHETYELPL
jgi:hypothetical protein